MSEVRRYRGCYGLCNVVYHDCTVGITVVHWCQGFITFLTRCIPYFEFNCRRFIERNCLSKECCSNLHMSQFQHILADRVGRILPLTRDNHQTDF